jgi:hypothetical protein
MKAYWGSVGIASRIFDLGTKWRRVVSFTTRTLYPQGKSPWYPLDRRLGGPQSRSGHGVKEKNSKTPRGIDSRSSSLPNFDSLRAVCAFSGRLRIKGECRSMCSWATSRTIGVLGFDSRRGLEIFLFITVSRTALGPTQPPIQWEPWALSLGVKRPGREADHSHIVPRSKCVELYLHSPNTPSWRGA